MSRTVGGDRWWALVAPRPTGTPTGIITVPHDRYRSLASEVDIGPLHLRPGGTRLVEYLRSEPWRLDGVTVFETWPVIVEGDQMVPATDEPTISAYGNPETANERLATPLLHRLCALLSLAWGEAWQVRSAPTMTWRLPPRVPESWPTPRRAEGLVSAPVEYPEPVPVWVARAWDLLGSDPHLSMGLTMWHQCLLLTVEFPSYALVALGGCIEELSRSVAFKNQLKEMPPACSQCGNVPGAASRFWEMVGLVASPDELSQLRAQWRVYGKRSKTAHGSALHGFEPYFGALFYFDYAPPTDATGRRASVDKNDPAQVFTLETLPMVGNIAARLLLQALNAPPP